MRVGRSPTGMGWGPWTPNQQVNAAAPPFGVCGDPDDDAVFDGWRVVPSEHQRSRVSGGGSVWGASWRAISALVASRRHRAATTRQIAHTQTAIPTTGMAMSSINRPSGSWHARDLGSCIASLSATRDVCGGTVLFPVNTGISGTGVSRYTAHR